MEKKKIVKLTRKTAINAPNCVREGIKFNLNMGNGEFYMYTGCLAKLINNKLYVFNNQRWVEV